MELTNSDTVPVVIIGGGISGLSTAFWLDKFGIAVRLFEADERVGGVINTTLKDGFLIEHGPSTLQGRTNELLETIDAAGLKDEVLYANDIQKYRYILKGGKPVPIPLSPVSFATTNLFSLSAKLRLLREPFIKPSGKTDESVAEFVIRRLGREILDYAVAPFVGGIYAGDPEKISLRSTFPRLHALETEYGSLIGGMVKKIFNRSKSKTKGARPKLFSFRKGLKTLPEKLTKILGDKVQTRAEVKSILSPNESASFYKVTVEKGGTANIISARSVVISTPSYQTAKLLEPFSSKVANDLRIIDYAPMAVVSLGYNRNDIGHPLNGFGMLSPPCEPNKFLGSLWTSSFFDGRAPDGKVLLTNFIGGKRHPELTELEPNELIDLVHTSLEKILHITGKPILKEVFIKKKAIPQYTIGYHEILNELNNVEANYPGLYMTGAYRGGVSVEDCIANGKATAVKISEYLSNIKNAPLAEIVNVYT
ncbi:MAG: protoporphyrinogen oxidase [Candidatus Marinimicrobia bacterium]|nr:protoporphyrinogen oxidase [Candidatus Neomarinimicrobiota bacterium]